MTDPATPLPQPRSVSPPPYPEFNVDELLRGPVSILVAFLLLGAIVLSLQASSGAWRSEFGGHPDEAAHYVTSLMLRDYVFGGGLPGHPMKFAENYYAHYPRVALGHYPPGFYMMTAPWIAAFGESTLSIMVFMALLGTLLALSAFLMARRNWDYLTALLAGAGVAVLPLSQRYTSLVMSDLALGLVCLLGAWAFGRFLATGKVRWSIAFAVLASAAVMVKASGLMLALVPPIAIVLAWRWDTLRNWRLWVAPPIVVALITPWTFLTYHITQEGMQDWTRSYPWRSFAHLMDYLRDALGWGLLLAVVAGLFFILLPLFRPRPGENGAPAKRGLPPEDAVMVAFPLALLGFYIAVPSGFDQRYLLPMMPACLVLAAGGILNIAKSITHSPTRRIAIAGMLATAVAILFFIVTFRVPEKNFHGFSEAAYLIHSDIEGRVRRGTDAEVLISSDANGEGAFIAELAQLDRNRPSYTVQRSSKMLSSSDWLGRDYQAKYEDPAELAKALRNSKLRWIVRDEQSIPSDKLELHHTLLGKSLDLPIVGSANRIPPSGFGLVDHAISLSRGSSRIPTPLLVYERAVMAAQGKQASETPAAETAPAP